MVRTSWFRRRGSDERNAGVRHDQEDGGGKGGEADKDAATHDCSPEDEVRGQGQTIGMTGVAALTAMAAKNTAPTNEKAMRWAVSKRNDMGISFDGRGVGPSGPRYRILCTARASFLTG